MLRVAFLVFWIALLASAAAWFAAGCAAPGAPEAQSMSDASIASSGSTPAGLHLARPATGWAAAPLDELTVLAPAGGTIVVADGAGREYFRAPAPAPAPGDAPGPAGSEVRFTVAGALGTHTITRLDPAGHAVETLPVAVDAQTHLDDAGGAFHDLLAILRHTMACYDPSGAQAIAWRGTTYHYYVPWILDHCHTAKGMRYFSPHTAGLVDLMGQAQRADGMIWSFVRKDEGPGYYDTAHAADGYARRDGGVLFARQPVENHCEYNFVEALYLAWKANGDDAWLAASLDAGKRALDYAPHDGARWSSRFELLKRGYTIDSWDFQVRDAYSVPMYLASEQRIDPQRTKFGVFFGDNQGYAQACDQLAELLAHAGRSTEAAQFRQRGHDIRARLDAIAWNGRFYRHRIEDDPTVQRDLGVDEASQIAMSNAYALSRGVTHEQAVAILRTYLDLKAHLPAGAPGEWYAIYPPFERGFQKDGAKWQYMNGGVHGHAAGELARGAFEHGFEAYGADILRRLLDLGRRHGGKIYFAYTGATEPAPPAPRFTPVDIAAQANMDLCDQGAPATAGTPAVPGWMAADAGNDMRNLPVGPQTFAGVPYMVPDPAHNGRRGAIAVAHRAPFPATVELPLGQTAAAIYLLHTANSVGPSQLGGLVTLRYADGTEHTEYLFKGKQLAGWWFPEFSAPADAGAAWRGPNPKSHDVGVSWHALVNPHPEKPLRSLVFAAPRDGAIYAVMGVTLADRPPHHARPEVSFGGPDNWAGGTCTAALLEGLAGLQDTAAAFAAPRLAPRWAAAGVDHVRVTARYPASAGYLAYDYRHDPAGRAVALRVAASGPRATFHLLLPPGAAAVAAVTVNDQPVPFTTATLEQSRYADFAADLRGACRVAVRYR